MTLELRATRLMAARRVEVARQVAVTARATGGGGGLNGSGKSTLLAAAAGLLAAGRGSSRHRPAVGYAPQRGDALTRLPVRRWLLGLGLGHVRAAQPPGHHGLLTQVVSLHQFSVTGWVIALHLAAALFGVGRARCWSPAHRRGRAGGSALGSALFLAVLTVPASPMRPLLRLAANPAGGSAATAAGLLAGTGLVLIAVTTFLASRLR